jgi:hypothetical protein
VAREFAIEVVGEECWVKGALVGELGDFLVWPW